jgi:23S rRNA G2445 N2-methylase RlmL
MNDLHETAKAKTEALRAQVDEVVNLKQMQVVKLQKELEALQAVRKALNGDGKE